MNDGSIAVQNAYHSKRLTAHLIAWVSEILGG